MWCLKPLPEGSLDRRCRRVCCRLGATDDVGGEACSSSGAACAREPLSRRQTDRWKRRHRVRGLLCSGPGPADAEGQARRPPGRGWWDSLGKTE